jgi:hypothetical protein
MTACLTILMGLAAHSIGAQEPVIPSLRGTVTAVQPPDGFDVDGYHVLTSRTTQFFALNGKKREQGTLRALIAAGVYVQVIGDKDRQKHFVIARQVKVRDNGERELSGIAVVDRIFSRGTSPVFRADGYNFSLAPDAEISFKGNMDVVTDLDAGTWIRYEGRRDSAGEVVATRAEFIKMKPRKSHGDPMKFAQVTTFPSGSMIDLDGSFRINPKPDKTEDSPGGECGWYRVPDVPAVQEHVRRVGMSLVPKYQRDLPDDDPARIPFRFYVVEEKNIRSDLSCHEGLVLVPVNVVNRLRNEDQLAAVLADGVAAGMQRQQSRVSSTELTTLLVLAPVIGLGGAALIGEPVVKHELARKMEDQRGRVALSLMADAGYDPWQAPEAWRLLASKEPPKDPSKLKYPDRAGYLLEILNLQYKRAAASDATAAQTANPPQNPN